ncbi:hypothetical protein GH733_000952 [Mirounga leonina]|nr:hypothetical protein GH733_000952 [Mirounga leonina]
MTSVPLPGDQLLQVDGVSLCGLTHKQAVQYLKGSGQVSAPLAGSCLSVLQSFLGQHQKLRLPLGGSLHFKASQFHSESTKGFILSTSHNTGPKFEVTLKKNASGLGFSFVQMEKESCSHLKNDIVRIKRLFPGQPAEKNGAIAAGDIILAVNGRPTEGLVFQTAVLSSDKEFTRATCTDSEQSPSLDHEDSRRDSASPDPGESLGLRPESFQKATREAQWDKDPERPWATSLMHPQDSHPHLCRLQQRMDASTLASSLEKDMRQNCYSVCDIRRLER